MKKSLYLVVIGLVSVSLFCATGCNSTAMVMNIDPAKQIAQDEALRINAKTDEFLAAGNYAEAKKFLVEYALSGNSAADREIGRLRLLLIEKVWNHRWTKIKAAMENKFSEYQKADSVAAAAEGIAYFSKLPDILIQPIKLPYWMDVADKDLATGMEVKRNKINGAFQILRDSYKKRLVLLQAKLEERDFRIVCGKTLENVKEALLKKDYVLARRILWMTEKPAIAKRLYPAMLAYRIGVLNTFVNPSQLVSILDEIDSKVDGFVKSGNLDGAIKYLEGFKIEGTDNEFLTGLLKNVQKEYGQDYCIAGNELEEFFEKNLNELQQLLDSREGSWTHPVDGALEKAISTFNESLKDEIQNEAEVRAFVERLRSRIEGRNMTTAALKNALSTRNGAKSIELSSLKLQKSVETAVAAKLVVIKLRAKNAKILGGIDYADEIYIAERTAQAVELDKGLLLAEYARIMRMLQADPNAAANVDKQVVLASALVLSRFPVIEWAVESGADTTSVLPFIKRSSFVLAMENGDKKIIAYLISNNAAADLERDGMTSVKRAIKMNRCDLIDVVYEAGFSPTEKEKLELINFACANGRDIVFFKYLEMGVEPNNEALVLAAGAGNLPIVRWFVETKFCNVNDEKLRQGAKGEARIYLIARGMINGNYEQIHKASK